MRYCALSIRFFLAYNKTCSDIIPIEVRAPSPTNFADESADTIVLDPELASIKKLVRSGQLAHTPSASRGTTPALDGGPETVTIRVKWKPHPMNDAAKSQQWDFKMKRVSYTVSLMECSHYMHVFSTIPSSVCSKKQLMKQECSLITSL